MESAPPQWLVSRSHISMSSQMKTLHVGLQPERYVISIRGEQALTGFPRDYPATDHLDNVRAPPEAKLHLIEVTNKQHPQHRSYSDDSSSMHPSPAPPLRPRPHRAAQDLPQPQASRPKYHRPPPPPAGGARFTRVLEPEVKGHRPRRFMVVEHGRPHVAALRGTGPDRSGGGAVFTAAGHWSSCFR